MSILDRLSLLVRSQGASSSYDEVLRPPLMRASHVSPAETVPTAEAVQHTEQQALAAADAGDTARARQLAVQAAAMEFTLTGGRFGTRAADTQRQWSSSSLAGAIPANPYGIANPPLVVAPSLGPGTEVPAGSLRDSEWYDAASPEERFDRYISSGAGPYTHGRPPQPSAGSQADDVLRTLRNLFDPERL